MSSKCVKQEYLVKSDQQTSVKQECLAKRVKIEYLAKNVKKECQAKVPSKNI